jgi:actin-related protein 9
MSGQTGKWREEQILIICPGSQTTMAQLGCSELTPPARRFPTRMFKDEESDDWRPYCTYKRKKEGVSGAGAKEGDEWEYVEDVDAVEGAVYPIQGEFWLRLLCYAFTCSSMRRCEGVRSLTVA